MIKLVISPRRIRPLLSCTCEYTWEHVLTWIKISELAMQELGDTAPFVNSNESGLKRRCIVMLELSATLARVLEFLTSRLPDLFLAGPPLNLSR